MIAKPAASKLYLYEFDLFVSRGQIHLKFPCTFFLTWSLGKNGDSIKNKVSTMHQQVSLNGSTIVFNAALKLTVQMVYDCAVHCFMEKMSNLAVYLTSVNKPTEQPKLAGLVRIDLANCLNSETFQGEKQYPLERCPDKSSNISFTISGRKMHELPPEYGKEEGSARSDSFSFHKTHTNSSTSLNKLQTNQRKEQLAKFNNLASPLKISNDLDNAILAVDHPKVLYSSIQTEGEGLLSHRRSESQPERNEVIDKLTNELQLERKLMEQLQSENNILRNDAKTIEMLKVQLQASIQQMEQQRNELHKHSQQARSTTESAKHSDEGKKDEEIRQLKSQIQALNEKLKLEQSRTETALKGITSSNRGLKQVTQYQQELELQQLRAKLSSAQEVIASLTDTNKKISDQIKKQTVGQNNRTQNMKSLQILEGKIGQHSQILNQIQEQLAQQRELNTSLMRKLDEKDFDLRDKQRILQKSRQQCAELSINHNEVLEQLKAYKDKQELLRENLQQLEEESGNIISQLHEREDNEAQLQDRVEQLFNKLNDANTQIKFMEDQLQERDNLIMITSQDLKDIKEQNSSLQVEVDNLNKQVYDLVTNAGQQRHKFQEEKNIMISMLKFTEKNLQLSTAKATDTEKYFKLVQSQLQELTNRYAQLQMLTLQLKKEKNTQIQVNENIKLSVEKLKQQKQQKLTNNIHNLIDFDLNHKLESAYQQIDILRSQIKAKDTAIRELQSCMNSFVHDGRANSIDHVNQQEEAASVASLLLASDIPQIEIKSPEVEDLKKQIDKYKSEVASLNEQLFAHSSVSNQNESKYEQLTKKHQLLQRQFKKYEKKIEEAKETIEQLKLQVDGQLKTQQHLKQQLKDHERRSPDKHIAELINENESYIRIINELRESETLNINELKIWKDECDQYRKLYTDSMRKNIEYKDLLAAAKSAEGGGHHHHHHHDHETRETFKQIVEILRNLHIYQTSEKKELQTTVLGLITKNKAIVNHFESLIVDKADLERRLLELSKELQRFKAKLLSNASCIEETKQVLLNTKPFELKIEEAKKGFLHLLNSFNVSSINDSMSEDEMKQKPEPSQALSHSSPIFKQASPAKYSPITSKK